MNCYTIINCMKARKILFYVFLIISIATNVLIIVESCIGGGASASQSFSFSEWFINILESMGISITNHAAFHSAFRKLVGHFLLFGFSGLTTALSLCMNDFLRKKFKWKIVLFSLGLGIFLALISELIQYFVPERYGTFTDIFIDLSGYIAFAGLVFLICFLIVRHQKKKVN